MKQIRFVEDGKYQVFIYPFDFIKKHMNSAEAYYLRFGKRQRLL